MLLRGFCSNIKLMLVIAYQYKMDPKDQIADFNVILNLVMKFIQIILFSNQNLNLL